MSHWRIGEPLLTPGPAGSFDETAVKDPSIVRHGGAWHLFYTARGQSEYTTGYVSAPTLEELATAPRRQIASARGRSGRYGCAPQVLFFRPQGLWYLVFQTRDADYQPAYLTSRDLADPDGWSEARPLVAKRDAAKWIDFWLICDERDAYLFFTRAHREVWALRCPIGAFPEGFGDPRPVYSGVHEAVHVYRAEGLGEKPEYHMIWEVNRGSSAGGERLFGLASAPHLAGPWASVAAEYASGAQLRYAPGARVWTREVSHGEALRTGCDERLSYDAANPRLLIQGLRREGQPKVYENLRWSLGIIHRE